MSRRYYTPASVRPALASVLPVRAENAAAPDLLRYFLIPALLHVLLVLLLRQFPVLGVGYVGILLLLGLSQLRKPEPSGFILVFSYIASAELIWRMTRAPVFWESGKYMLVLLLLVGLLRWKIKLSASPFFFLVLLVPSAIVTLSLLGPSAARDALSFNLSGPLLLGLAALFFKGIKINRDILNRLLLVATWPIIGIFALSFRSTLISDLVFTNYSNFATSGGYGPNQVSAILGLGVLFCWLYLFIARPQGLGWWLIALTGLALLAQALLTFSRGGILNLAIAIPVTAFFFTRSNKQIQKQIFILLFLFGLALAVLLPQLNEFTGNHLLARYEDLSMSGREEIMLDDLRLWQSSPLFGVGVGMSSLLRQSSFSIASHTEYTRLLAEHGLFGLLAMLLLLVMLFKSFRYAGTNLTRGVVLGLLLWSLAEMAHAAMRIAVISTTFAIPLALLELEDE